MNDKKIWAVVLAAGKSERMQTQKLLLPVGDKTMIRRVVDNILSAGLENIMVVLGANAEEIATEINREPVSCCVNHHFAEGMHTSVICGISNLPEDAEAALFFLGDMPFIPARVIVQVIEGWQLSGKKIVIPVYNESRGHPALFDLQLRKALNQIDPRSGLRSVIARFPEEIFTVPVNFSGILRDIDTKNDYFTLLKQMDL